MQEPYGQNYETVLRDIKQILKNWEIYHIMDGNTQYWKDTNFPKLIYGFSVILGFPHSSVGKESACNAGDPVSIPGLGRFLEKEMATHSSILAWRIPWTE